MKSLMPFLLLLLGFAFAFYALWIDWLYAAVATPALDWGANVKNYKGFDVFSVHSIGVFMLYYAVASVFTVYVHFKEASKSVALVIFKGILVVNTLIIGLMMGFMATGYYLEQGHSFYAPKEGFFVWLLANAILTRQLWKIAYSTNFEATDETLLDDLPTEENT